MRRVVCASQRTGTPSRAEMGEAGEVESFVGLSDQRRRCQVSLPLIGGPGAGPCRLEPSVRTAVAQETRPSEIQTSRLTNSSPNTPSKTKQAQLGPDKDGQEYGWCKKNKEGRSKCRSESVLLCWRLVDWLDGRLGTAREARLKPRQQGSYERVTRGLSYAAQVYIQPSRVSMPYLPGGLSCVGRGVWIETGWAGRASAGRAETDAGLPPASPSSAPSGRRSTA